MFAVEELREEIVAAFRAALETGDLEDLRRAQAAELILSRALGKPLQQVEDLTERDDEAALAAARERASRVSEEQIRALGRRLRAVK